MLCKAAGGIHLFKLMGRLMPGCITLKRNWIWNIIQIDWTEGSMTLNGIKINLPTSVVIPI